MNLVDTRVEPLLEIVAGHIERVVPTYERAQADVRVAVEDGTGNCLSKAVIAAVVFEHLTSEGSSAVFYNKEVHPSPYADWLGREHKGFGHAAMLAQTDYGLWTVGFNLNNVSSGDHYVANTHAEGDETIFTIDKKIKAVGEFVEKFVVGDWYDVYREYMEAVDIATSSAHTMERSELEKLILSNLKHPPQHTDPSANALRAA